MVMRETLSYISLSNIFLPARARPAVLICPIFLPSLNLYVVRRMACFIVEASR